MAEKTIIQTMVNGVCVDPDLWPDINRDAKSMILTLPPVSGNTVKVGIYVEPDYKEIEARNYTGTQFFNFTVPLGITTVHYGIAGGGDGAGRIDNVFKLGTSEITYAAKMYHDGSHISYSSQWTITSKDNIVVAYLRYSGGTNNLLISHDHGKTFISSNCSYSPSGKIVIGGATNEVWVMESIGSNGVITYSTDSGITWHQSTITTGLPLNRYSNILPVYMNGYWYIVNFYCTEIAKTNDFVKYVVSPLDLNTGVRSELGDDSKVTSITYNLRQLLTINNRIYILALTNVIYNGSTTVVIPFMRYTDDNFQTIHTILNSFWELDAFTEYRYAWGDPTNNDLYFTNQTGKIFYKSTNGFVTYTKIYDGTAVLGNMNLRISALSKDYLYLFNSSGYTLAKYMRLSRRDNTASYVSFTAMGSTSTNTPIAISGEANSDNAYILGYNNDVDTKGINIYKSLSDSTDYSGSHTNDTNSHSKDPWISSMVNGVPMIWKNRVSVTPGQVIPGIVGGGSSVIIRWGTGSSIKL